MKRGKEAGRGSQPPPKGVPPGVVPALPAWKAFVVQFSRETSIPPGAFSGRVEHLSSGRRAQFSSAKELLAALTRLLADLGENSDR